jgi:hypothetical protein
MHVANGRRKSARELARTALAVPKDRGDRRSEANGFIAFTTRDEFEN